MGTTVIFAAIARLLCRSGKKASDKAKPAIDKMTFEKICRTVNWWLYERRWWSCERNK